VSIDALKQELAALNSDDQRHLTAFLVSLQDSKDVAYRRRLAEKIDRPASSFASLEDLDMRFNNRRDQGQ